jgi:heat shock protein HtpX
MKRILLFVVTNLAIMVTLSIVLGLLGITGYVSPTGQLDYGALMLFCLVWGMGGAFISLAMSRLTQQAQLPMPEVGFYESAEVNAFATGPSKSKSLVAVSSGLIRNMRREEIEGVLAHEIAHIQNGDMVTMTLIQGVVNAFVMFLARVIAFGVRQATDERYSYILSFVVMIVLEIAFGILGMMIVAWFSRAREFRADAGGAALAGRGNMIAALQRLMTTKQLVDKSEPALATLKISGARSWMALVSTHPPLEERIKALQSMQSMR